jgi:hypothetical protein
MYRRLGGAQSRSGRCGVNFLVPTEIWTPAVQPVAMPIELFYVQ